MSMEIQLINQIEKFEFLYNYNLPEYNRKDLVEEAWANIAANTNLSISDCKEKWRNIRSSFLRSMKPSGTKVKKPYYLTDYLKFILPYLKPITIECIDDTRYETQPNSVTNETVVVVDFIKSEPGEYTEHDVNTDSHPDSGILGDLLTPQSPVVRKRRRFVPKRNMADLMKSRSKVSSTFQKHDLSHDSSDSSSNSAMKMFLLSLLPELESMTDDQVRLFKIKSMMLIDDIKQDYSQMRQNTSNLNNERLQKRLINLLLKSLQRTNRDKEHS